MVDASFASPNQEMLRSIVQDVKLVIPGDRLRSADGALRGHGTFEEDGFICASICGVLETVDQLVYVRPVGNSRYEPEVGDVVVGRIDEVCSDRWRVDIKSYQRGQLPLAGINLPGGEQRRRNVDDQLDMRKYYQEGDCVCLEVQRVQSDGGALLHTRNTKYGKLRNGTLVTVPPALVRRQPCHMITLACGVYLVLGNNGLIWIGLPPPQCSEISNTLNFVAQNTSKDRVVSLDTRKKISAIRNIILALGARYVPIMPQTISFVYNLTVTHNVAPKALLDPAVAQPLCRDAYHRALTDEYTETGPPPS